MEIKAFITQWRGNAPLNDHDGRYPMPNNLKAWGQEREDMTYMGRVRVNDKSYDAYSSVDKRVNEFAVRPEQGGDEVTDPVQIVWTYLVNEDGVLETMLSNVYTVTFSIEDEEG